MVEEQNPAGHVGIGGTLSSLAADVLAYLQARLELFGIEFREAGGHYVKLLLLVAGGAVLLLFAYLLLLVSLAFGLALLLGVSWIWITLGLGGLHFLGGAALLLLAKAAFQKGVFSETLSELKKDRVWITEKTS